MSTYSPVRTELTTEDWQILAEARIMQKPELEPYRDILLDSAALEREPGLAFEWLALMPVCDVLEWAKYLRSLTK